MDERKARPSPGDGHRRPAHRLHAGEMAHAFEAISAKIEAQADYVCWRDRVVVPSQKVGGRISVLKSGLPAADPGTLTAHRWRKRFCLAGKTGTGSQLIFQH